MLIEEYKERRRPVHITSRGLFCAFLAVLAVLLLAAWIQTMVWFRADYIELTARQERNLAEASELLEQARVMSGEVSP